MTALQRIRIGLPAQGPGYSGLVTLSRRPFVYKSKDGRYFGPYRGPCPEGRFWALKGFNAFASPRLGEFAEDPTRTAFVDADALLYAGCRLWWRNWGGGSSCFDCSWEPYGGAKGFFALAHADTFVEWFVAPPQES